MKVETNSGDVVWEDGSTLIRLLEAEDGRAVFDISQISRFESTTSRSLPLPTVEFLDED
ncbi:hypothetical protein HCU74_08450 [Spongiibacter sp. KMU-166]|uniref:Uncharacterized protein n=1 Tax=Spongiibacter thalassae TaxID=2721624 RepID=A0ABX1GEU7_9GAMM|nr:hypothetical protein [Spongiibacter thalassae]NKI17446.1 hypothetical protein [Spongiibacter thalassae]